MSGDGSARRFITRPSGKFDREDRAAVKHLWSLLYRAVRRDSVRLNNVLRSIASVARRLGALNTELLELRSRVDRLERRYWSEHERRGTDRTAEWPRDDQSDG